MSYLADIKDELNALTLKIQSLLNDLNTVENDDSPPQEPSVRYLYGAILYEAEVTYKGVNAQQLRGVKAPYNSLFGTFIETPGYKSDAFALHSLAYGMQDAFKHLTPESPGYDLLVEMSHLMLSVFTRTSGGERALRAEAHTDNWTVLVDEAPSLRNIPESLKKKLLLALRNAGMRGGTTHWFFIVEHKRAHLFKVPYVVAHSFSEEAAQNCIALRRDILPIEEAWPTACALAN